MWKSKTILLNVAVLVVALAAGAGTLFAVRAEDSCTLAPFYHDADGDGYGNAADSIMACSAPAGYVANNTDCDDTHATAYPGAAEVCDGFDNNCDGQNNEGLATSTYYMDFDHDSYGTSSEIFIWCALPASYAVSNGDCDDKNAAVYPAAAEICDGADNDCDGETDEGVLTVFYLDPDHDGYGASNATTSSCNRPADYATSTGDCDNANASVHPGVSDICDAIDNDCDGAIDEDCDLNTYYRDADADGYGSATNTVKAVSQPAGYIALNGDCNDYQAAIHPGVDEVCNGLDDDCDGSIDEGLATTTYYRDVDGDNYGGNATSTLACVKPSGYAVNNTDCDDSRAAVHPGASEICDGLDNDCDGSVDEELAINTYYYDADNDGWGRSASSTAACSKPSGYAGSSGDCDDTRASVYPGAPEIDDDLDNDCDGNIDENQSGGSTSCTCKCTCECGGDCNEPDENNFDNHGQYVSCLSHYTNFLKKRGAISGQEKGQIINNAAKQNVNVVVNVNVNVDAGSNNTSAEVASDNNVKNVVINKVINKNAAKNNNNNKNKHGRN
jgi:large repetitive protein